MSRFDDRPFPTVRDALEAEMVPDLRRLASMLASRPPTRKGELITVLERCLTDPDRVKTLLAPLDDLSRAAVAEAAHGNGQLDVRRFAAKYGSAPDLKAGSRLRLFFDGKRRLPDDLRKTLRGMVAAPPPAGIKGLHDLPEPAPDGAHPLTVRVTEHAAQADLMAVLRLCDMGKLRCSTSTSRPGAATVKAVAEVLEAGDFYPHDAIAAFAWPLLLQAGNLAEPAGGRLRPTARGRRALQAPAHVTLDALWRRWLDHGVIDEFSRIDAIKGQQSRGGRNLTAVSPRRYAVAEALSDAPLGCWVAVDAFFAHVQASDNDFEVVRDPWRIYLGDPEYGSFGYAGYGRWSVVQGRFTLCLLFEFAATLGLIDVAYGDAAGARNDYRHQWGADDLEALSRYDGLRYFRLNALGAYCLGVEDAYRPGVPVDVASGRSPFRVLPNLDLVFTGERLAAADKLLLESYAEPRSAGVWALDRRKLLASIARGQGVADLERFLQVRTEPPLPDAAACLLDEVRERAASLKDLGMARVVACADADLARLLEHDRRLRAHCRLVGDRHLLVPLDHEDRFRRALLEVGYALPPAAGGPVSKEGS